MIEAKLEGRDFLRIQPGKHLLQDLKFQACSELLELLKSLKSRFGSDLLTWQVPGGSDHASMLVRELLLKMRGQWKLPYEPYEICHCRAVPTHVVDQAIVAGAHSVAAIGRWTTASTACGTCQPDVEKMLKHRLG